MKNRHLSLRTIILPEVQESNTKPFTLSKQEQHHLVKVLRLSSGSPIRVSNGKGTVYNGQLVNLDDGMGVEIQNVHSKQNKPSELELLIALPKSGTMESLLEKAVECGVTRVLPMVSTRSVVRPDLKEIQKYTDRWQKIMDEACEQSERAWRPEVLNPVYWKDWSADLALKHRFVFSSELRSQDGHDENEKQFKNAFLKLKECARDSVSIAIGPEGGWSGEEREKFTKNGFQELSLGHQVLKVETSVVAALTLVRLSRSFSIT